MTTAWFTLLCAKCQHTIAEGMPDTCPNCGGGYLTPKYEFDGALDWPAALRDRPRTMWRYRELLPLKDDANIVSMGEGGTPLIRSENLGAMLGLKHLYLKDERQGPTGSFKDRQAALAISALKEHGQKELVVASTGNVAIAYSAYAARARIKLWVFTISSIPPEKMREVTLYGTELIKVTGTYDQAKQVAARFAQVKGLPLDQGLRSIAARESMKTLAFEIAEQLGEIYGPSASGRPWRTPDWYFQAVSGGLGPVGVVEGFRQLDSLGLSDGVPRLGLVQSTGCDPMVRAFDAGQEEAPPFLNPSTRIATVATDVPGMAYLLLRREVLDHDGAFVSATDEEAYQALKTVAQLDGVSVEPATALAFAGLFKLVRQRRISPEQIVVVNVSGHTFPVEKHILGDNLVHDVDLTDAAKTRIPHEGLLSALEAVDRRVQRVVVIEDDPGASQLMARILRAHGVSEVFEARDGQEGIAMVYEKRPYLIVLDLMMPNVDGFGVLDRLKADAQFREVPVVVVTAKDLTAAERTRLAGQVDSLLQKGNFIDEAMLETLLNEKLG
ncbi:MAG TPA: pyridoxal-phosphate dependent enzyme [Aggregatilineales bacterium]|nr:pyridoxal-phosphate dependent enzyme [Aggregatilineales bacterium]